MLDKLKWYLFCKFNKVACPKCSFRCNESKAMEQHWFDSHMDIPSNREQRRKMAKRAGQIKDWKHLNDD